IAVSGNPAVVTTTRDTPNSVGYGDLSDWLSLAPAVKLAQMVSADGTATVSPNSGTASNCSFQGAQLPGLRNARDSVGLSPTINNTWLSDPTGFPATRSKADLTSQGSGYPICGMTWAVVYPLHTAGGTGGVSRLNDDQRRTLYAYFTYVLSPLGQEKLAA